MRKQRDERRVNIGRCQELDFALELLQISLMIMVICFVVNAILRLLVGGAQVFARLTLS